MENEEVIRQDMEKTRESLTEKLETLEQKLVDSVQGASAAVKETVSSVKDTMHEGVETVKDAVDINAHVERQPWLMFGGAILCGYVLGTLLESRKTAAVAAPQPAPQLAKSAHLHGHGNGHSKREKRENAAAPAATTPPQPQQSWLGMLEPEINQVKGLALGVALGTVREMLTEQVPPHLAGEIRDVIDAVTKKVGGEPLPSADFEFIKGTSCAQEEASAHFKPDVPRF